MAPSLLFGGFLVLAGQRAVFLEMEDDMREIDAGEPKRKNDEMYVILSDFPCFAGVFDCHLSAILAAS